MGKYFSKAWTQRNILRQTVEEIEEMEMEIYNEAGDPTAQPSMMMPPMGMDPNAMGGGMSPQMQPQDPYAQDNQDNQGVPQ